MPEHACLSRGVRDKIVYLVSSEGGLIHLLSLVLFIVLTQHTRVVDFVNKVEWLMGAPF